MTSLQLLLVTCSPSRGKSSQRYTVFSAKEVTPLSADKFERRLEKYVRELARVILQRTIRKIESDVTDQTVASFEFTGQRYRRNRRTRKVKKLGRSFGCGNLLNLSFILNQIWVDRISNSAFQAKNASFRAAGNSYPGCPN